ncbi:putative Fe-containing alcohol dehydrogenase [Mycena maculata]|uniref:Fe-containing alcohol dehydrogenase n=1 Tax=Mycena maculata TaxID=230809 RepID=A0AAD7NKF0_9AGAR|nr:putative Fe-containing alcohol dehydrogenase [Mycena maculata]
MDEYTCLVLITRGTTIFLLAEAIEVRISLEDIFHLSSTGITKHPLGSVYNNCYISYGLRLGDACAKHAEDTFHAKRILIISLGTVARSSTGLKDLQEALGNKVVGVTSGLRPNTYFGDDCRKLDVDLIVTLGGGSLSDASKLVALVIPVICVATTLSGGEFTSPAGATDDRDNIKYQFITDTPAIRLVILDAEFVTAFTPIDARRTRRPRWMLKRLLCQMASINAISAIARVYTPPGGPHAIGHMLGPLGVGHGETSGILLAAVCKYNARHRANLDRQVAMRNLAEREGLKEGVADLGDILTVLVQALDMPTKLADVGVSRENLLDPFAATNPMVEK